MTTEKKPENPTAFPVPDNILIDVDENNSRRAYMGMDLRDYFAGKAMQTMVAGEGAKMVAERDQRYNETNWAEIVASNAYDFADAMLKERSKK